MATQKNVSSTANAIKMIDTLRTRGFSRSSKPIQHHAKLNKRLGNPLIKTSTTSCQNFNYHTPATITRTIAPSSFYKRIAIIIVLYSTCIPSVPAIAQTLTSTVGEGGVNHREEVRWVQAILNQVPELVGGPTTPLVEDGLFGPNTLSAIKRFQQIQLGIEDGLIEPDRRTHQRLLEFVDFENQARAGAKIAWGAVVTGPFKAKLLEISESLEIDPNHLMAAMAFETGETFSPAIKNAAGSGATGLIQFMPRTASNLGTTTDELARMSAVEQLDYVQKYFEPYKGKCRSLSDVYMAILWPAAVGKPDDHVLFDRETRPTTYDQNRGLDTNPDGKITKLEAASKVQQKLEKGTHKSFSQ